MKEIDRTHRSTGRITPCVPNAVYIIMAIQTNRTRTKTPTHSDQNTQEAKLSLG